MAKKNIINPVTLSIGAAVMASALSISPLQASENPFVSSDLKTGFMIAEKGKEGMCGENHSDKSKSEGKCGESKGKSEGKGEAEGKCGEGKCGEDMKSSEGKCGEGKCGENKSDS